ncbi:MAG TPA: hypothetical protein VG602_05900 [Actinomycetota bacterium]|nr:hypothetical protein [Actinomycetota bacterium]
MRKPVSVTVLVLLLVGLAALPGTASHGPTRSGADPCNGTNAFNVNNVITRDVTDAIAAQNPAAVQGDGTLNRTLISHALFNAAGHVVIQVRETTTPLARVAFGFSATNSGWNRDSTNHPGYLTAIDASEQATRDADSDLVVGNTFLFFIPTDVVPDGNYVARFQGFDAAGTELGRVCVDAIVQNGQGADAAFRANTDPAHEPTEPRTGYGYSPQPVVWFPAGEAADAQKAGYGAKELRIEFGEKLAGVKVERFEGTAFVDRTAALAADDFRRPHFLAGGRLDGSGAESSAVANEKVWGPGYKLDFSALTGEALPGERLRITATDLSGRTFCGVYTFTAANGSYLASKPGRC